MATLEMCSELQDKYDQYYDGSEAQWRLLGAIAKAENIIAMCSELPHSTILEIGAGDGAVLDQLSQREFGETYSALEISSSGVAAIESREIPQLRDCRVFDGYEIPYDRKFDLAILSHVIEHVEFPRKLLYEAARVAQHVFVEVPLEETARLSRDYVPDKVGHINFYSPTTIRRLMQTCNFSVVNQSVTNPSGAAYQYSHGFRGRVNFLIKEAFLRVSPRVATNLFTYHSALVCRPAA